MLQRASYPYQGEACRAPGSQVGVSQSDKQNNGIGRRVAIVAVERAAAVTLPGLPCSVACLDGLPRRHSSTPRSQAACAPRRRAILRAFRRAALAYIYCAWDCCARIHRLRQTSKAWGGRTRTGWPTGLRPGS